jgi:hypothetical protein
MFSPKGNQTDSNVIEEIKPSLLLVGYANDVPIFRDFNSENLYYFNGEFKYYMKGKQGFAPVYCNDSVFIYVALEDKKFFSNEVIITKGQSEKKVILPHKVSGLVSNMNGDTLFYTNGDNEVDRIRIFDVTEKKEVLGIYAWYEGFWYSKGKFYYYIFDEEEDRSYIYTTSVPPIEKGILITNTSVDNMSAISYDGNYLSGSEKFSEKLYCVVSLKTGEFKRVVLEMDYSSAIFSFFYKNKAYFYHPSTLEIKATISLEDI